MIKNKITAALTRFRSEEDGAISAVVAVAMVLILACAALVVDLGSSYHNKISLQNAVDNSARTAGYSLPCALDEQSDVIAVIENCMTENGFPTDKVDLSYEWTGNSRCYYAVRINATADVGYVFASALGSDAGIVTATAKITCAPVTSTFKAISVYIEKTSFENQLSNIQVGQPFTITITSSGASNGKGWGNMGIMRIVPSGEESTYVTYNGWSSSTKGDPIFFEQGYWRWVDGVKTGISVGEQRTIENAPEIYTNAYDGLSKRVYIDCPKNCGASCSADSHLNSCPRIALLPVVTTTSGSSTSGRGYGSPGGGGSSSSGTATIQYFVAIYIKDVINNETTTTITAYYLDDYRETSDVDPESISADINPLMVCSTTFEE